MNVIICILTIILMLYTVYFVIYEVSVHNLIDPKLKAQYKLSDEEKLHVGVNISALIILIFLISII